MLDALYLEVAFTLLSRSYKYAIKTFRLKSYTCASFMARTIYIEYLLKFPTKMFGVFIYESLSIFFTTITHLIGIIKCVNYLKNVIIMLVIETN
ncbi:hypothetical protein PUN28_019155 [Cardiocondyla obscurior]|uniref:Uncharacterized protein n=1 Tax=Cardiocondyla obscurior TaxID=286306 RepID=A0AAW2EI35_9HYME